MVLEESLSATGKISAGLQAVINDNIEERLKLIKQKVLFITLEKDKLASSNKKAFSLVNHAQEIVIYDSFPQYCWTHPKSYASIIFDFVLN